MNTNASRFVLHSQFQRRFFLSFRSAEPDRFLFQFSYRPSRTPCERVSSYGFSPFLHFSFLPRFHKTVYSPNRTHGRSPRRAIRACGFDRKRSLLPLHPSHPQSTLVRTRAFDSPHSRIPSIHSTLSRCRANPGKNSYIEVQFSSKTSGRENISVRYFSCQRISERSTVLEELK